MPLFSDLAAEFECPYQKGCPYLEGLSTHWVWSQYQRGQGEFQDPLRGVDEMDARRQQQAALLLANDFPIKPAALGKITEINLASGGQVAGLTLGRMVTLFVLMFVLYALPGSFRHLLFLP